MRRTRNEGLGNLSKPFTLFYSLFSMPIDTTEDENNVVDIESVTAKGESDPVRTFIDAPISSTDTAPQQPPLSSTEDMVRKSAPTNENDKYVLSAMLEEEVCETGIQNPSEVYFRDMLQKNRLEALNTLCVIFFSNFSTDTKKINIAISILHLISHLDYDQVHPNGQLMALTAIAHRDREMAEYGIKCYENWGNIEGVDKLKAVHFSTQWLQDYANQVIEDLNEGE